MIEKFIQDALIIWATIDPIGTMAIFAALTAKMTDAGRRRTAIKTFTYATIVLMGSIIIGQIILNAMGISLVAFQVSGGIILFLFGLQMIFGSQASTIDKEPEHDIAVFPLAIPATATPGAILAVILLTDNQSFPIPVQVGTALITLAVMLATLVLLLLSGRIIKIIGHNGASILTRIMGMILAALSAELIMSALNII